jgi:hypothetical protein
MHTDNAEDEHGQECQIDACVAATISGSGHRCLTSDRGSGLARSEVLIVRVNLSESARESEPIANTGSHGE